jgi:hypothetical protein
MTNQLNIGKVPIHNGIKKMMMMMMSLYMDDLKLLGRSKDDLKNEIKIVKTISKDINMNIRLVCKNLLKIGTVHSKTYIGSTFKDIKELDLRK